MLKELFIVNKTGTLVYHNSYTPDKIKRDPVLLSAFITAIEGFSNETFDSEFKGMEFDNQTVFVVFKEVYFIGIFSYDELSAAAFYLLNSIADKFNSSYKPQDYEFKALDLDGDLDPIFNQIVKRKVTTPKLLLALLLVVLGALCFYIFEAIGKNSNIILWFYLWVFLEAGVGVFNGWLMPQRWIAFVVGFIYAFIPSGIIFFSGIRDSFFLADYSAFLFMVAWVLSAYGFERRHINVGITSRIPFVSRI